jgi:hypothetical protein
MERAMRLGLGLGLLGVAWLRPMSPWARIGMAAAGAESLLTAALGYCPLNAVLGHSSYRSAAPLLAETLAADVEVPLPPLE